MPYPPLPLETPRTVTRSGGHIAGVIVLSVLFGCPWAFTSWLSYSYFTKERGLSENGVETTGQIVRWHKSAGRAGVLHQVIYKYHVDGKEFTNDDVATGPVYENKKEGGEISILYDKFHHNISAQNADGLARNNSSKHSASKICAAISFLFFTLFILSLFFSSRSYRRKKKLLTWGTRADAKIIAETEYKTRSGAFSEITYEFSVPGRGTYTGTRKYIPTKESPFSKLRRAPLIDNPVVLYQPDNPENNALYPLTEAKLRQ